MTTKPKKTRAKTAALDGTTDPLAVAFSRYPDRLKMIVMAILDDVTRLKAGSACACADNLQSKMIRAGANAIRVIDHSSP